MVTPMLNKAGFFARGSGEAGLISTTRNLKGGIKLWKS